MAVSRYEVETIVEEKIRLKVSLNNRINQCGFCGDTAQKVCWECFQTTIDEMQEEINQLRRQVNILLELNGKRPMKKEA